MAPKDLLASMWKLASTLASFQASLIHSSVMKISWIAYKKMTKESYVKEKKKRREWKGYLSI